MRLMFAGSVPMIRPPPMLERAALISSQTATRLSSPSPALGACLSARPCMCLCPEDRLPLRSPATFYKNARRQQRDCYSAPAITHKRSCSNAPEKLSCAHQPRQISSDTTLQLLTDRSGDRQPKQEASVYFKRHTSAAIFRVIKRNGNFLSARMPFPREQLESVMSEQLSKSDTIKLRQKHIGQACQLFYRSDPLKIVRGQGQYMFDEEGTRYLDCINNVAHVGHCHPKVVRAGCLQMATISTNNRFLHDELVQCAKTLTSKMPPALSVCFFVNSGSEANDLALRLARNYTKRQDVITLDHAYHGHLTSVMEISPYKFNQPGGDAKPDYVHVAPCPDVYGGKYIDKHHPNANMAEMYAQPIIDTCEQLKLRGQGVAAFIAESLQSCGGQIIPPEGYFRAVYKAVRETGGLCIADEVQVGFGRVGSHYWAFETQGVVPDIVTVAKPMGNGHPVGAVVTTPAIAEALHATGVAYFNTYGGNPVSCAIANAVMRVIEEEGLQENARAVGDYLLRQCNELKYEFGCVGDVRGLGLFVGVELVQNRETREPDTKAAHWVVNRMKQLHKILVSSDGPNDNVVKLKPPMCFNQENADEFLLAFRECLSTLTKEREGAVISVTTVAASNAIVTDALANTNKMFERRDHMIKSA